MVRHFIDLKDVSKEELETIVGRGIKIKEGYKKGDRPELLKNLCLIMLFQKTSTRTRVSFETGMSDLGGHAIFLDWKATQFQLADIKDEAKCLNRYCDILMARVLKNEDLMKIVAVSHVPVVNALCERYHPCQTVADIQTMKEHLGSLEGKKVVYLGIANNVSNTLSLGCTKLGMKFVLCVPERHPPSLDEDLLKKVKATGLYSENSNPEEAVKDADILYTDTWIDMELFLNPDFKAEKERRLKKFMPYQLNKKLMDLAPKALSMHDLPAHRGYEIDDYAMDCERSIVFDQAENRLHAQKAIMCWLLNR